MLPKILYVRQADGYEYYSGRQDIKGHMLADGDLIGIYELKEVRKNIVTHSLVPTNLGIPGEDEGRNLQS